MRDFICSLAGSLDIRTKTRPNDRRGQHHGEGRHAGLLLQRYACQASTGETGNPEEKRAVLKAALNAPNNDDVRTLYRSAYRRWSASLPTDPAPADLHVEGRLIVGLGSENVLETGIRLHHTYGLPIIPGSALKGLAAHYCHEVWGASDSKFLRSSGDFHRLVFGTTEDSGCVIFHDAWYVPDSSSHPLVLDVMTPHHLKWLDGSAAPTDFDSPSPVPFLSATGQFHVAVSWNGPECEQASPWSRLALSLLQQALSEWGVGGKTSSGYGRLGAKQPVESGPASSKSHQVPTNTARSTPPAKRSSSTPVKVKILAKRDKGGYQVQEAGKPEGSLTLGPAPSPPPSEGDEVEVLIHNDDPQRPQYKWKDPNAKPPKVQPNNPRQQRQR